MTGESEESLNRGPQRSPAPRARRLLGRDRVDHRGDGERLHLVKGRFTSVLSRRTAALAFGSGGSSLRVRIASEPSKPSARAISKPTAWPNRSLPSSWRKTTSTRESPELDASTVAARVAWQRHCAVTYRSGALSSRRVDFRFGLGPMNRATSSHFCGARYRAASRLTLEACSPSPNHAHCVCGFLIRALPSRRLKTPCGGWPALGVDA
jgi:hypothetical protein